MTVLCYMLTGPNEISESETIIENRFYQPSPEKSVLFIKNQRYTQSPASIELSETDPETVYDQFNKSCIGDGLPVIPLTAEWLIRMIKFLSIGIEY